MPGGCGVSLRRRAFFQGDLKVLVVRYKNNVKPGGMPVRLPVGLDSESALKQHNKTVYLNPTAELPDEDALKLVRLDPHNFELVLREGDVVAPHREGAVPEADVHEGLVHHLAEGTEFAKKRGRPRKEA